MKLGFSRAIVGTILLCLIGPGLTMRRSRAAASRADANGTSSVNARIGARSALVPAIQGTLGRWTMIDCLDKNPHPRMPLRTPEVEATDWNRDGTPGSPTSGIMVNANYMYDWHGTPLRKMLVGQDDWTRLRYAIGGMAVRRVGTFAAYGPDTVRVEDDLPVDEINNMLNSIVDIDCNGNGRPDDIDITLGSSQDVNGNCIPDECEGGGGGDGDGFLLGARPRVAPNPVEAGRVVTIALAVPKRGRVELGLYNLSGRRLGGRTHEAAVAGMQRIRWVLPVKASGVYFLRVRVNGADTVERTVVVVR